METRTKDDRRADERGAQDLFMVLVSRALMPESRFWLMLYATLWGLTVYELHSLVRAVEIVAEVMAGR